jgi:transposase
MRVFKPIPERSAMTNRDPILPDAVIDIAKARIEASHHRRRRSVLDTRAEHNRLIEALKAYGRPVICAFEATGNYHRPMAWRLIEAGFDVRLVWCLAGREN